MDGVAEAEGSQKLLLRQKTDYGSEQNEHDQKPPFTTKALAASNANKQRWAFSGRGFGLAERNFSKSWRNVRSKITPCQKHASHLDSPRRGHSCGDKTLSVCHNCNGLLVTRPGAHIRYVHIPLHRVCMYRRAFFCNNPPPSMAFYRSRERALRRLCNMLISWGM